MRQLLSVRCGWNGLAAGLEDLQLLQLDNEELRRHHNEEVRNLVDDQAKYQHAIAPGGTEEEPTPPRAGRASGGGPGREPTTSP